MSYQPTVNHMQAFTDKRDPRTRDELWILQHPPVFTLGQAADRAHILNAKNIDVVQTDRGGQVTYHGPGQLVVYVLVDLKRRAMGVRTLVSNMENAVIKVLADFQVHAKSRRDAPGVYVSGKKIAALGLRVRRGCTFHGLSLNVDMDLTPFSYINPCGFEGLQVTQLKDEGIGLTVEQAGDGIAAALLETLSVSAKTG